MQRRLILFAILVLATAWSAVVLAQRVEHGRGNVVSIDTNRLTVDLRDPQGRTTSLRFNRNATVKFTDGASFFPNPSVSDLRPPMYVHYTFSDGVIDTFDVVELGFQPGADASSRKQEGVARTVTGRVTAYDPAVQQVEIEHNGERETFQLTDRSDMALKAGDRVTLRTDWSGQRELVAEVRSARDGSTSGSAVTRGTSTTTSAAESAEGRVVRISERNVVMQVAGTQQSYSVDDANLLRRLRVGDTVRFNWRQDRDGRMFITGIR